MTTTRHPDYFAHLDRDGLLKEFPLGSEFVARFRAWGDDQLRAHQSELFSAVVERAWQVPFYQRLWGEAGIEKGDIKGLDDLTSLPVFDKSDIMASIDNAPPWGDFHGIDFSSPDRPPVITHTTTGTTGKPQVLVFGPRTREVQNMLLARAYQFQGLQPSDVVQSIYGHGLVNGGHYIREAITHWTGARFLSAGTGIETPSRRQIELMRDFGVTVLVGFADYFKILLQTAQELNIDPCEDLGIRMISGHIGMDGADALAKSFGDAEVFDWYGVGDTGIIAAEGPDHDGLYVMQDAHILELLDVETGSVVDAGDKGDMVVTSLFTSDVYPIIRFNTHDVSSLRSGKSALDMNCERIDGFLGRSDNMIKLRGINIFPHAIASFLSTDNGLNGEYLCRHRVDSTGRETLVVDVESSNSDPAIGSELEDTLRAGLGVAMQVRIKPVGSLSEETAVEVRQKAIRLIDEREQ